MPKKKSQVEKFREAAREAGTDESEDAFNATLKDIAGKKPSGQVIDGPDDDDQKPNNGRR